MNHPSHPNMMLTNVACAAAPCQDQEMNDFLSGIKFTDNEEEASFDKKQATLPCQDQEMNDFLSGIKFTDDEEEASFDKKQATLPIPSTPRATSPNMLQLLLLQEENMGEGKDEETLSILKEALGLGPTPVAQTLPNPTANNIRGLNTLRTQAVPRKRMWQHIAPSEQPVHQIDGEELTLNDEPPMEFSMEPCDEPGEQDVICERGSKSNHHPRNKQYLADKDDLQARYSYKTCPAPIKTVISRKLVNSVLRKGGRFLKRNEADKKWYLLAYNKARKKASQALREINTTEERAAKRARVEAKKLKA